jgi:hypothetical protein
LRIDISSVELDTKDYFKLFRFIDNKTIEYTFHFDEVESSEKGTILSASDKNVELYIKIRRE